MDNEIKSKLNNKYNLSSEDYEMISARIDELRKAIEDVIGFEEKNKLSNNPKFYCDEKSLKRISRNIFLEKRIEVDFCNYNNHN